MEYLLFTFYLAIACFFITRISFIKNSRLSPGLLLGLFFIKIFAGIFIGWMSQKFYPQGNDYWGLNDTGRDEYHMLLSNPARFFKDIFWSPYQDKYGSFFNSTGSYWNDLRTTLITKGIAFCDFLSGGNYYINSLFFNFCCFFGHIALYRVFADIFQQKKWQVITGCFLLPSTLYFTSGIHKDLVVFTMLGFFCYALYFSLLNKPTIKYLCVIVISFIVLLLMRNFLAIAILPAAVALFLCNKINGNKLLIFAATYCTCFLMLILLQAVKPSFRPVKIISERQRDFLDLPAATSQLNMHVLQPTITSLIKNAPGAFNNGVLQPYIWGQPTRFLIVLATELLIYQVLFILMLFWHEKAGIRLNAFVIFGLCISISLLMFTGYIVPNTGSIVRYKSLYLPFLITPLLSYINWKKLGLKSY